MEKLNILLWAMGAGFAGTWMLTFLLFKNLREEIRKLREALKQLRQDVQDIDRRLCRLEGAFSSKDCCMIKDPRQLPKAD